MQVEERKKQLSRAFNEQYCNIARDAEDLLRNLCKDMVAFAKAVRQKQIFTQIQPSYQFAFSSGRQLDPILYLTSIASCSMGSKPITEYDFSLEKVEDNFQRAMDFYFQFRHQQSISKEEDISDTYLSTNMKKMQPIHEGGVTPSTTLVVADDGIALSKRPEPKNVTVDRNNAHDDGSEDELFCEDSCNRTMSKSKNESSPLLDTEFSSSKPSVKPSASLPKEMFKATTVHLPTLTTNEKRNRVEDTVVDQRIVTEEIDNEDNDIDLAQPCSELDTDDSEIDQDSNLESDIELCNIFDDIIQIESTPYNISGQFDEIKIQVKTAFEESGKSKNYPALQDATAVVTNLSCTNIKVEEALKTSINLVKDQIGNAKQVKAVLSTVRLAQSTLMDFVLDISKLAANN